MKNLEIAKSLLKSKITLALVKENKQYSSTKRGIAPMMDLIAAKVDLNGYCAADKVVGKAVAMLFCLAGISEVYAEVISEPALKFLQQHKIKVGYDYLVKNISNRTNTGVCPMEQAVKNETDPHTAYEKLKQKLKENTGK